LLCCCMINRYTLVLQIFNLRAKTKEAKLQVALAELPYLRYFFTKSTSPFRKNEYKCTIDQELAGCAASMLAQASCLIINQNEFV